jgi:hypothetical protein
MLGAAFDWKGERAVSGPGLGWGWWALFKVVRAERETRALVSNADGNGKEVDALYVTMPFCRIEVLSPHQRLCGYGRALVVVGEARYGGSYSRRPWLLRLRGIGSIDRWVRRGIRCGFGSE